MTHSTPRLAARRRAGLGLAAAALLALTACGGNDPYGAPAPTAASASELPPMDMAPFTLDIPDLDLALVPGASMSAIEGQSPEFHGAWLEVPGARSWTDAMAADVRAQVEAYQRDTDLSADPSLEVQPRLAVAGQDLAAVRLLSTEKRGTESVSSSQASWYSAREDRVLATSDLFTAEGWTAFRAEVRDRMANDPDIVQERLTSAVEAPDQAENRRIWDAVVLLPDGSALLEVDQAALAPAAAGVLTARIPSETVRPWLSELGRTAQDAARTPAAVRLPQASSSPAGSSEAPSTTAVPVPPPLPATSEAPRPPAETSNDPTETAPTRPDPTPADTDEPTSAAPAPDPSSTGTPGTGATSTTPSGSSAPTTQPGSSPAPSSDVPSSPSGPTRPTSAPTPGTTSAPGTPEPSTSSSPSPSDTPTDAPTSDPGTPEPSDSTLPPEPTSDVTPLPEPSASDAPADSAAPVTAETSPTIVSTS